MFERPNKSGGPSKQLEEIRPETMPARRPDQVPIAGHKEKWLRGTPDAEIATIERRVNALVEADDVEMLRSPDTTIAAVFFATRKALNEHGIGLDPEHLVGQKHRETRWGKLMLAKMGMDMRDGNMKVTIRPLIASNSGSNKTLETGMRQAALYLKGQYGLTSVPEYTVEGTGVSDDDADGHDPRIAAARRAEIQASRPPKIEQKR